MPTYIYGLARASHPLPLDGAAGVGVDAPALRLIREGELAAVVSDAPADLRPKRRDLTRHGALLERLCAAGAVLPMRFGVLAADDGAIRTALRSGAARYARLLSRIEGHVEVNIKGVHDEDAVLRDLLLEDRGLAARNQSLRAAGGGSHQDKLQFGERVAAEVERCRARDRERVVAALRPHAGDVRLGPGVDGCFVNVSFLVAAGAQQAFDQALARLRDTFGGRASLTRNGPLPPYSFAGDEAPDRS